MANTQAGHEARGEIEASVRRKYAEAARAVERGRRASCGPEAGAGCCGGVAGAAPGAAPAAGGDAITRDLYPEEETLGLPADAIAASLGCGNPTALAELRPGEVVLDLGSGGGIDVLLSARRVGPEGKAYGVDMTDEMLALARRNQRRAGVENAEFLKGEIEDLPLPDASVDVVISNCVINLSGDKERAIAEAYRVLKPGGRFAVSDIVVRGALPEPVRTSLELWAGCIAGALEESEYRELLEGVGFASVEIEPTRVYDPEEARELLAEAGLDPDGLAEEIGGRIAAAFIRAGKPRAP